MARNRAPVLERQLHSSMTTTSWQVSTTHELQENYDDNKEQTANRRPAVDPRLGATEGKTYIRHTGRKVALRRAAFRSPLLILDEAHHVKNPATRLMVKVADSSGQNPGSASRLS